MKNNEVSQIAFTLDTENLRKLKAIAEVRQQTTSEIVTTLVQNHIFQYELNMNDPEGHTIQKTIEKVLKEYAPVLEKLSKT